MQRALVVLAALILSGCVSAFPQTIPIDDITDLGNEGLRIAIGDPDHVPAGMYAMETLERLMTTDPDLYNRITQNIISHDIHVRSVLNKVVTREVDAGFVYRTDAQSEAQKVRVLELPEDLSNRPEYVIVLLNNAQHRSQGTFFIEYLKSIEGQETFKEHGFIPVIEDSRNFEFSKKDRSKLTIFAAASLSDCLTELAIDFQNITGIEVEILFGSSGSLLEKIRNGAVADIFFSASTTHADLLVESGLADGYETVVRNELVLVVYREK